MGAVTLFSGQDRPGDSDGLVGGGAQQAAQVAVAAFMDAEQRMLAAAGVLSWNKTEECSQLPAVAELSGIASVDQA